METDFLLMTLVIFLPAAFGLSLLLFPSGSEEWMRWWALTGAVGTLTLALCLLVDFYAMLDSHPDRNGRPLHGEGVMLEARADLAEARETAAAVPEPRLSGDMVARRPWIPEFNIRYALGLDGFSMPLVLLTCVVMALAVLAGWSVDRQARGFLALMLILQTGVLGAFMALDLFLFYVFYELMIVPMYFLIGIWGGVRRKYAALKFVVYTLGGSLLILVAVIAVSLTDVRDLTDPGLVETLTEERMRQEGITRSEAAETLKVNTFDIVTLQKAGRDAAAYLEGGQAGQERHAQPFYSQSFQVTMFMLMAVGFAVKIPLVPLHSWLPDAHVEAPTAVSMVLAGVLLKLGGYGLIRFAFGFFPWAAGQLSWYVAAAGAFAIVYGALTAMGQTDFKRMLAYSSVSHMGYVVLGAACWGGASAAQYWSWGMAGGLFQMVAHGITSAGLFFAVGVVSSRAGHRDMARLGGLTEPMPAFCGYAVVLFLAALGLPGLCGFVGEFMVMLSAWHFSWLLAVAAIGTTVLTAGYLLWSYQRVFLGVNPAANGYTDIDAREAVVLSAFAALTVALGVLPTPLLLAWSEPSVTGFVESLAGR